MHRDILPLNILGQPGHQPHLRQHLPGEGFRLAHRHFVSPSDQLGIEHVIRTIIARHVTDPTVPGNTGTSIPRETTQSICAKNKSGSHTFNPLPTAVVTPINIPLLDEFLRSHPDPSKVDFVLRGFQYGFDIGFRGPISITRPKNLRTAYHDVIATTTAINKEVARKHTSGRLLILRFRHSIVPTPRGCLKKPDGSSRLILYLSSPRGSSINEGIITETSVSYSHFDDAVNLVRQVGTGAFLANLDIRHAFRICPVLPTQWPLLGFQWEGFYYVDTRLPFGSRTSPFLFNSFAELLCWILVIVGGIAHMVHYLDDYFLTVATSAQYAREMDTMRAI